MKYYICRACGDLKTEKEIDKDFELGGNGLCDCEYMQLQYDHDTKSMQPVYFRIFNSYTEISFELFDWLKFFQKAYRPRALTIMLKKMETKNGS